MLCLNMDVPPRRIRIDLSRDPSDLQGRGTFLGADKLFALAVFTSIVYTESRCTHTQELWEIVSRELHYGLLPDRFEVCHSSHPNGREGSLPCTAHELPSPPAIDINRIGTFLFPSRHISRPVVTQSSQPRYVSGGCSGRTAGPRSHGICM